MGDFSSGVNLAVYAITDKSKSPYRKWCGLFCVLLNRVKRGDGPLEKQVGGCAAFATSFSLDQLASDYVVLLVVYVDGLPFGVFGEPMDKANTVGILLHVSAFSDVTKTRLSFLFLHASPNLGK